MQENMFMECPMRSGKENFKNKIGWRFDNSYTSLPKVMLTQLSPVPVKSPKVMLTQLSPVPVKSPKLVILNYLLSKELDLNFSSISNEDLASMFAGNILPEGSQSFAQAYAGHQFGYFTILGDGRAIMIGEHVAKNNKKLC